MKVACYSNVPKKYRKMLCNAVKATAAHKPMPRIKTITIIACTKKQAKKMSGQAYLDTLESGIIYIDCRQDVDSVLDTIFHEAYHIHQFATGILRETKKGTYWRGFLIPPWFYDMAHSFVPFEISATHFAGVMCKRAERLNKEC